MKTDLDLLLPLKQNWIRVGPEKFDEYLANSATNNINVWSYTNHTLYDLGKLDLIVLRIVLQIIQESLHAFLMATLLG